MIATKSKKYQIPGFVELDNLPQPDSIQYPANDVESSLCAYAVYFGAEVMDDLISYGVSAEKFMNAEWARLWELLRERRERDELVPNDLPLLYAKLKASGFGPLYARTIIADNFLHKVTFRFAGFMWATMLNDRYRKAQVTEQTTLGIEALKDDKDEESKLELLKAIDFIEDDINAEKEVEGWKEIATKYAQEAGKEAQGIRVMPTGIHRIDEVSKGGIRPGDLWVFGGGTGGGKSALMLQCLGFAAKHGARALVVSMEMTKRENLMRILAGTYGGNYGVLMTDPAQVKEGTDAYQHTSGCILKMRDNAPNLKITEKGTQTVESIRALVRRHRPDIVAVDYIGLIQGERSENREERYSRLSNKLKAMAKDFSCAVVTGAQLNDQGKLYGARSIAFDATLVATISDEGLFLDKVRNAPRPDDPIPYFLNGERQRFEYKPNR